MANTIKIKNSVTPSNAPSSLEFGELAINVADEKLFYKNSSSSIENFDFKNPLTSTCNLDTSYTETGDEPQGSIYWNDDEETINLVQNGAVLQLGQELQVHCRNNSGSTISNGTVCMATGTIGASGRITIAPYDGTSDVKYIIGIATENIVNDDDGKVTTFGKVRGLDTSSFSEGTVLYTTTNGGLTATEPSSGVKNAIAFVVTSSATVGTIMVRFTPIDENNVGGGDSTIMKEGENISLLNNDAGYQTASQVATALDGKQATLVSGTNIKTINNTSLLGSGDINIEFDVLPTNSQTFTTSGTFTVPTGVSTIMVYMANGGGGGGGGHKGDGTSRGAFGSSGGGGGGSSYSAPIIISTTQGSTFDVIIGSGGSGGSGGTDSNGKHGGNGGIGGTTSFGIYQNKCQNSKGGIGATYGTGSSGGGGSSTGGGAAAGNPGGGLAGGYSATEYPSRTASNAGGIGTAGTGSNGSASSARNNTDGGAGGAGADGKVIVFW